MYARGIDMQGINWDSRPVTREACRKKRVDEYENYLCLEDTDDKSLRQQFTNTETGHKFYDFKYAKLSERCSIGHFQLRNLLWATSKDSVYYMYEDTVRHWSPHFPHSREVLNVRTAHTPQSLVFAVSSMACAEDILFMGGSKGEYAYRRLDDKDEPVHYGTTTNHSNGIANHINVTQARNGETQAIVSSNDQKARFINLASGKVDTTLSFPFAVNCSALSPDKRLLCVVGDDTATIICDASSGKGVHILSEHHDFSFACCWSPDGRLFATGNQDKTTRIYDIRQPTEAIHVLGANVGAIRSLQFTHDGQYLIAAEPIDFVHIYDASSFQTSQVIDFFGEIAGVSLSPEDQALFIAAAEERIRIAPHCDERIGGLFEFRRETDPMSFYF
ncbi:uncharacterized wd repeat-containing [Lichtheimia corymbifera JMRC:FSU:9682]|uniref:Uncharacterized wd repeat-containing n=1 Tax=Lichtheimia corymbifera JMRC:FSU:9682 TaxID=1263082 RepID=A0A068RUP1_9FUNG|nr:uncharacterized wd repeat-containing [Lichtheimia corymbifera JMRC:FSU:9682]